MSEIERLRKALTRLLLEFDFLIEGGHLPDIRNDVIFDEARAALASEGKPVEPTEPGPRIFAY